MEDWEVRYMERLATIAASGGGSVLEVGFGLGLAARAIQAIGVRDHVVIECHPGVIRKCLELFGEAIQESRLHVMSGFWEDITPKLAAASFDGILFDTYPLSEDEIHSNHFAFFKEAYRLLKHGGVLTYYSDEAENFSPVHRARLIQANFADGDISREICYVRPPADCEYWTSDAIMVPIIYKS